MRSATINLLPSLAYQYQSKEYSFPIITAVLDGVQEGIVYSDGIHDNYFVIHKFGFAELIENESSAKFDDNFIDFLLERKFTQDKIRWYNLSGKWINKLKSINSKKIVLVDRVQLARNTSDLVSNENIGNEIFTEQISELNYEQLENHFSLSLGGRFWSSKQQFLTSSFGVVAYINNSPAAICYACAIGNGRAEVDVFTDPGFRLKGLGKLVVGKFINMCIERGLKVNWDCYTNNNSSFQLAKHFSFTTIITYKHAIISR